jgi:hypothetical protein
MLAYTKDLKVFRSKDFNYNFDMKTGFTQLWGRTVDEDPEVAPFPVIADIEITEVCAGPGGIVCPFCVPAETLIQTLCGEKQIKDIKIGDEVISYDTDCMTKVSNKVLELYCREYEGDMITISDGTNSLELTPEHPVYTLEMGWVFAKDIKENMTLIIY